MYVILFFEKTKKIKYLLALRHMPTNFFQTGCNDRNQSAVHLDASLNDLDLQSESQL